MGQLSHAEDLQLNQKSMVSNKNHGLKGQEREGLERALFFSFVSFLPTSPPLWLRGGVLDFSPAEGMLKTHIGSFTARRPGGGREERRMRRRVKFERFSLFEMVYLVSFSNSKIIRKSLMFHHEKEAPFHLRKSPNMKMSHGPCHWKHRTVHFKVADHEFQTCRNGRRGTTKTCD